jgi:hypothetical protein
MKTILLIFSLIFIAGCATVVGQDFPIENVEKIEKGITSKSQIFALFGEPREKKLKTNNIEIWA